MNRIFRDGQATETGGNLGSAEQQRVYDQILKVLTPFGFKKDRDGDVMDENESFGFHREGLLAYKSVNQFLEEFPMYKANNSEQQGDKAAIEQLKNDMLKKHGCSEEDNFRECAHWMDCRCGHYINGLKDAAEKYTQQIASLQSELETKTSNLFNEVQNLSRENEALKKKLYSIEQIEQTFDKLDRKSKITPWARIGAEFLTNLKQQKEGKP